MYLKATKELISGEAGSIRYVAELPQMESGQRYDQELVFNLEPIYTTTQREAVLPDLGNTFELKFATTSNVEDDGLISFIVDIESAI